MTADELVTFLRRFRFRFQTEGELQNGIEHVLTQMAVAYRREVHLGSAGRIDFVVEPGIGLEVKVDGSTAALTRQVHGYAQVPELTAIVVVTSRMRHALQLPRELNGKPVRSVALSGGLL